MTPYLTLGATDLAASAWFYDATLAAIGWACHDIFESWRIYSLGGDGSGLLLYVGSPFNGQSATQGNGVSLGLPARSRAEVDAFHAAGLAHGGSDEGAPGLRAQYGPNWYGAYLRDPTGNKLIAFHDA